MMTVPPWVVVAQSLLGTKEFPGADNNPKIMAWARVIGGDVEHEYLADSIPWCGLFVTYCFVQAGIKPVSGPLWALNWRNFGNKESKPSFGSIFTMSRSGGGHVGFVVSQDRDYWHVLGGNQNDEVNILRISKNGSGNFNFPSGFDQFKNSLPFKEFDGKVSHVLKFD